MKILLISLLFLVAACSKPSLPAPTVKYPAPPSVLMEPSQDMTTIPNGE